MTNTMTDCWLCHRPLSTCKACGLPEHDGIVLKGPKVIEAHDALYQRLDELEAEVKRLKMFEPRAFT